MRICYPKLYKYDAFPKGQPRIRKSGGSGWYLRYHYAIEANFGTILGSINLNGTFFITGLGIVSFLSLMKLGRELKKIT